METVFHYGKESEKFLREFEEKRADCSLREVADLPVDKQKALLAMLRQENRTFAEPASAAV